MMVVMLMATKASMMVTITRLNFKVRTTLKINYTNSPKPGADSFLTAAGDAVTAGGTKF